ncbi:hypothetical protein [Plasmodium yoelii yoelii]|uniref:Uncharacterized protein n=1 Tax=Plasmodium yoelii yoelii TaxID=73239 RepID=Q7R789_PLAYO|nr:hypothetical protein [Plasmodium yoelii yoelii]
MRGGYERWTASGETAQWNLKDRTPLRGSAPPPGVGGRARTGQAGLLSDQSPV